MDLKLSIPRILTPHVSAALQSQPGGIPFRRGSKWRVLVVLAAVLVTAATCEDLREVRKRFEGTQEPSVPATRPQPPNTSASVPRSPPSPAATAPVRRDLPRARAPEVAAIPGTGAPDPSPGRPSWPSVGASLPGIHLTPPPGVVPVTRVAILLPLSGPDTKLGQALLNASQLALFSLAGDGFALLPVDTGGTPDGAEAAVRSALEDGARLILGPVFASSVAAASPRTRQAGVQMIAFSNDRSVAGNGVYIMGFTPETQIGRVMAYAAARGVKRLAVLLPEGVYGTRVEKSLRAAAGLIGITVSRVARYGPLDTQSLSPIVRRLANYDARRSVLLARRKELDGKTDEASLRALKRLEGLDTLGDVDFDAVLMPEGAGVLRALAPLLPFYDVEPRKVRMLGTAQWDDSALATEPALFGGWFPAPPPGARRAFETLYHKTYGATPPRLASLAYDATALAAVLTRARGPAAQLAAGPAPGAPAATAFQSVFTLDALTAANGFSGVDGIFRLLPSGLVERGLAVMEVRNRRFVVVSPAPATFQTPAK
jgi:branched-chain amino acid transport system substrate-binding protein